jgi:hypothetical protein
MDETRQAGHEFFRALMVTVVGQAYQAAGYSLEDAPLKWLNGQYRWLKALEGGLYGLIDYQVLIYSDTPHAARTPSRFRVALTRADNAQGRASAHPAYATRTLSALVVDDFGVAILPSADHWWTFHDTHSLGQALAEAGHLVIGYGLGWLDGSLSAPHG